MGRVVKKKFMILPIFLQKKVVKRVVNTQEGDFRHEKKKYTFPDGRTHILNASDRLFQDKIKSKGSCLTDALACVW